MFELVYLSTLYECATGLYQVVYYHHMFTLRFAYKRIYNQCDSMLLV